MALRLYYRKQDQFVELSQNGDMNSPLATVHDGKTGDTISVQLYVRNNNSSLWYSNIEVFPFDKNVGEVYQGDVNYEHSGWGVKLSLGAIEPTKAMWDDIEWAEPVLFSKIGDVGHPDTAQYHPFWMMITCPPNHNATTKDNISLRVEYTENTV